ncbi:MAG: putative DNA binding domain-containing protein [Salinivirgaceae bacterium]|nr:putative DNA binding domain-containing protein [Salinivirgaceae bacterium]
MNYIESEQLELKSSFGEWKEIIVSLTAFANKNGGVVIVGLDDLGQPLHLQLGKHTIEDFVNKLKANTDPVLYPSINIKTFGLGNIVEISIPKSDYKPVFAFNKAWERVGKSNVKLSANKLRELILRFEQKPFDDQLLKVDNFKVENKWAEKVKFKSTIEEITIAEYLCL